MSAEALRMVMKAVEARGRSSFQTEIMLMQIRGSVHPPTLPVVERFPKYSASHLPSIHLIIALC